MSKRDPMSVVGSATLLLEAITIALAIPFALRSEIPQRSWFIALCVTAIVLAVVATAFIRRPLGVAIGWSVQLFIFVASVLVPAMISLAVVFTALWITALWVANRVRKAHP